MPHALALSRHHRRLRWAVGTACLVLIAAIWGLAAERVTYERQHTIRYAQRQNANLALSLGQHVGRTLKSVDALLRAASLDVSEGDPRRSAARWKERQALDTGMVSFLGYADASGRLVFGSTEFKPLSLADREFFAHLARNASQDLFVGKPVVGRVTGRSEIPVARRVDGPHGEFLGIVMAGIDVRYFSDFYDRIEIGRQGLVALVREDGAVIAHKDGARLDAHEDMADSRLLAAAVASPTGSFVTRGRLDGVPRFASYRAVEDYPILVTVGTSVKETLAGAHANRRDIFTAAAAGSLIILLAGAGLLLAFSRHRHAVEAQQRSDTSYRVTFDRAPLGIAHNDLEGNITKVNGTYSRMLGYGQAELLGRNFLRLLHPEDAARALDIMRNAPPLSQPLTVEQRQIRKDGTELWTSTAVTLVADAEGRPSHYLAMVQDISHQKNAEGALRKSEERFRRYFELGLVGMAIAHPDRGFLEVNDRVCEILGYAREELLRLRWCDITHADDLEGELAQLANVLAGAQEGYVIEKRLVRKDGRIVPARLAIRCVRTPDGKPDYFIGLVDDLTAQKEAAAKLERHQHYDSLTGLPNRALFGDRLAQALAQARRKQWTTGLLYLNLDRFKHVNGALGHAGGDDVLRQVAERMAACVRAGDTVARVGADEFAVALAELHEAADASLVARKVMDALSAPFTYGDEEVVLSASIGIATEPPDGSTGNELLKNAASAMARAKERGRNGIEFYAAGMNERLSRHVKLHADLRRALERREFFLHYQPKAAVQDGKVCGFEALLRWKPEGKPVVSPAEFIPLLEETGMIVAVGQWVIDEACAQIRAWRDAGLGEAAVAINVSARQFTDTLCDVVGSALAQHGVEARLLEIEITESDAMRDPDRAIEVLNKLRALGVTVSIDDFGTGYSSLGYLKRFPIQALKLDRSFVSGVPGDPDDVSIARAVISMAHSLGLKVVAEGVETEVQRRFLAENGCDLMQGYLLSRPLPAADCAGFLPHETQAGPSVRRASG